MRVGPTLAKILADYPEDVRVVYKMHPLSMHKNAMPAAEAAMAAHAQGKFVAMHEKLLASSAALSQDRFVQIATEIGLDVKRFTHDLATHAHQAAINVQTAEAMKVGATGTPASFVNGRYLSGAAPYDGFKRVIDEEIAKATK